MAYGFICLMLVLTFYKDKNQTLRIRHAYGAKSCQ